MPAVATEAPTTVEYHAWFQCIAGCPAHYSLQDIIYRCPRCGNLLEVRHDLERLRQHPPAYWKHLFDTRFLRNQWPYGSSVWGKKEMSALRSTTPTSFPRLKVAPICSGPSAWGKKSVCPRLWIKQCGNSHTGSFKDLGMTVLVSMVRQMIAGGKEIPAVACASTGDTSAALAAYCAVADIPAIVFLPRDKVSVAQLIQPIAHGALTLSLATDFDGCMALVQEIVREQYLSGQFDELFTHRGPKNGQYRTRAAV